MNQEEYLAVLESVSTAQGPDQDRVKALDAHTKRLVAGYQVENKLPVLRACVVGEQAAYVRKLGYQKGWTNKNRTAQFLVNPDSPYARMFVHETPARTANPDTTPGRSEAGGELMKVIGEQLRAIREATGLSQNQFSKQIGVTQNDLSLLERGKSSFTINTIEQVLRKMGYRAEGFTLTKRKLDIKQ